MGDPTVGSTRVRIPTDQGAKGADAGRVGERQAAKPTSALMGKEHLVKAGEIAASVIKAEYTAAELAAIPEIEHGAVMQVWLERNAGLRCGGALGELAGNTITLPYAGELTAFYQLAKSSGWLQDQCSAGVASAVARAAAELAVGKAKKTDAAMAMAPKPRAGRAGPSMGRGGLPALRGRSAAAPPPTSRPAAAAATARSNAAASAAASGAGAVTAGRRDTPLSARITSDPARAMGRIVELNHSVTRDQALAYLWKNPPAEAGVLVPNGPLDAQGGCKSWRLALASAEQAMSLAHGLASQYALAGVPNLTGPLPPIEAQLPRSMPDGARAELLRRIDDGELGPGVHTIPGEKPWGEILVWVGSNVASGDRVIELYQQHPADDAFYLRVAGGNEWRAALYRDVCTEYDREVRHFVEQGMSISEARERVFEIETEVFKLVLESAVDMLNAGASVGAIQPLRPRATGGADKAAALAARKAEAAVRPAAGRLATLLRKLDGVLEKLFPVLGDRVRAKDLVAKSLTNPAIEGLEDWIEFAVKAEGDNAGALRAALEDRVNELAVAQSVAGELQPGMWVRIGGDLRPVYRVGTRDRLRSFDLQVVDGAGKVVKNIEVDTSWADGISKRAVGDAIDHAVLKIVGPGPAVPAGAQTVGTTEAALVLLGWPPQPTTARGGQLVTSFNGDVKLFTNAGRVIDKGNFFAEYLAVLNGQSAQGAARRSAAKLDAISVYDLEGKVVFRFERDSGTGQWRKAP